MRIPLEEIVRRLVLLGLPLVPLGCGGSPPRNCPPDTWESCIATVVAGNDAGGDPAVKIVYTYAGFDCTGRRCEGAERRRVGRQGATRGTPVGRWLAEMAALEAESVPAFQRLSAELAAHGAPRSLVEAARGAARDEVRHFRLAARAARARGAVVEAPRFRGVAIRSLAAVAAENACEGCVRETLGAATAAHQARHARDAEIRTMMQRIAADEARHAQRAWQVDDWARARLSAGDARRIADVKRRAGDAVRAELLASTPADPTVARSLTERAHQLLWS
jgi:hypothetical protein